MRGSTSIFHRLLGSEVEWDYLDGTARYTNEFACVPLGEFSVWPELDKLVGPTEVQLALAKGEPFRGWHVMTCHAESDERHWQEKMHDRSVTWSYDSQAEESAERVLEHVSAKGPFDVLLGVSQALVPILIAAGLARERGQEVPWRLTVAFSPFPVSDARFKRLFQTPLDHPALLCYGRQDWAYEVGRNLWPVNEYFARPVILEHEEAHGFPQRGRVAKQFYTQVMAHMWRHCRGAFWKVVGGAAAGGILVRSGCDLQSEEAKVKLAHDALVREIEVSGNRLHYQLLQGEGPPLGWVNISLKQKPLLARVSWSPSEELPTMS